MKKRFLFISVCIFATAIGCDSAAYPEPMRMSLRDLLDLTNGPATTEPFLPLPAGSPADYTITNNDQRGDVPFAFDTVRAVHLKLQLRVADRPAVDRVVQLRELRDGRPGRVLFRALTDDAGTVRGNLVTVATTNAAQLEFATGGRVYAERVPLEDLLMLDRSIHLDETASRNGSAITAPADTDGDGIADEIDDFPGDAAYATRVHFPTRGRYTVAFEDLYPAPGDADFNDYVIQARQEEHLNAAGEVARIVGSYRHVAKAAGYNHFLRITLSLAAADYEVRRFRPDGSLHSTSPGRAAPFENVVITERSDRTIPQANAQPGQAFAAGDLFELEIVPDTPVSQSELGPAPYDLHLYVANTGRAVHFAGKFFDDDGHDLYRDDDGFPWALLVPVDWRWMYERRDIFAAYEFFTDWYSSGGELHENWYNFPDLNLVFENVQTHYSGTPEFLPPAPHDPADFIVETSMRPVPVRIESCYIPVGALHSVEALSGTPVFAAPGSLRIAYDGDKLSDAGFSEDFTVFAYDATSNSYAQVPGSVVDESAETVTVPLAATGTFVLTAYNHPSIDGDPACASVGYPDGIYTYASVAANGSADGYGGWPALSADGRYVVFDSSAPNLVVGDTNATFDIFVHDRQSGDTSRVSRAFDGSEANSWSNRPDISADGRFVTFYANADNLVGDDTNGRHDVFVHDRNSATTVRVSLASDGSQANGHSYRPAISANGRYVAFDSLATNLVPGDSNNRQDVFVHDRQSGQTDRVSVASDGSQANHVSFQPRISADGRYVVFFSAAWNLAAGDTNGEQDVFVHDRQTGTTTRLSVASNGTQGNDRSFDPDISDDGRFVTFNSFASNLVTSDTNSRPDAFVHDLQTGQTTRVSTASDGTQGNSFSSQPRISADGRYVTFLSDASNLVGGDTNGIREIFVHDRQSGSTRRVSVSPDGSQANNGAFGRPALSADGRYVVFESTTQNLMPGVSGALRNRIFVFPRP